MSIIDKLGITPSPWEICSVGKHAENIGVCVPYNLICTVDSYLKSGDKKANIPDAQLIAASPEMLEALIKFAIDLERSMICPAFKDTQWGKYLLPPIEKACYPKSWEEIKERIKQGDK